MNCLDRAKAAENRDFSPSASTGERAGVRFPRTNSRLEPLNRGAIPGSAGVSPASSDFWLPTGRRDAGAPRRFMGRCRRPQFPKPEECRFYKGAPNNDLRPGTVAQASAPAGCGGVPLPVHVRATYRSETHLEPQCLSVALQQRAGNWQTIGRASRGMVKDS